MEYLSGSAEHNTSVNIALFPIGTLGDGLIFLILAQCLADKGHKVSFYSNMICDLDGWFPDITLHPLPEGVSISSALNQADVIVCDPHQQCISAPIHRSKSLLTRTAWITATRMPSHQVTATINCDLSRTILGNDMPDGTLRRRELGNLSMVEFAAEFCRDIFQRTQVRERPRLQVPPQLKHRQYAKRVAIFPETPSPEKNYPLRYYLSISRQLKKKGLQPEFVLTCEQYEKLSPLLTRKGMVHHVFNRTSELVAFIYESGSAISNDSGGGHLASFLYIPTVTIYKKKDSFEWRPGWKKSLIVRPLFSLKAGQRRVWGPFVNRRQITDYVVHHALQIPDGTG